MPVGAGLLNPVGLGLLAASLLLSAAMVALPALWPWAGRAAWVGGIGVVAYAVTVLVVVGQPRREPRAPEPSTPPPVAEGPAPRPVAPEGRAFPAGLTAREVAVLRLIAGGKTNKEIAVDLVVSIPTVERHVANIYGKIGARGRAEATAYALTRGLVTPRPPSVDSHR